MGIERKGCEEWRLNNCLCKAIFFEWSGIPALWWGHRRDQSAAFE